MLVSVFKFYDFFKMWFNRTLKQSLPFGAWKYPSGHGPQLTTPTNTRINIVYFICEMEIIYNKIPLIVTVNLSCFNAAFLSYQLLSWSFRFVRGNDNRLTCFLPKLGTNFLIRQSTVHSCSVREKWELHAAPSINLTLFQLCFGLEEHCMHLSWNDNFSLSQHNGN